ncbi:hypothetical protein DXD27_01855 [Bacteroides intestinalis]|uniref:Uncharacterized protein n=1 Tax=Bacteroides intestinalis TaxID=329854 RepID=A0A3E4IGW7_9BACE|nr:hypothetical protein [Bacteroides oleiciplenus]QDO68487.1 hypothetical protein DXK01_005920 [Bacteroides intestinalis]MBD9091518.1 hypothetical protein [Bacteroides oleiciplenus]RGJ54351.1 hypothetical protein DXD57_13895 [Bacteroides intestinalis]RGK27703.1 hypothetical protein DXD27_01855 [Bacteroides intestinalis]
MQFSVTNPPLPLSFSPFALKKMMLCHRQNLVFQLRDIPFCYWQKDKNNKAKYSFQPNAL